MSVGGDEPVAMGNVEFRRLTDKALLVFTAKAREVWIPLKAIHDDSEIYGVDDGGRRQQVGDRGKLVLKRWFTDKQGWTR